MVILSVPRHEGLGEELEGHKQAVGKKHNAWEQQCPRKEFWILIHLQKSYFLSFFVILDLLKKLIKISLISIEVH